MVGQQTVNAPKGSLSGASRSVVLSTSDQVLDAAGYRSMVVAYHDGAPVRIGDLGAAIDGPEDSHEAAWLQGKRTIIIDVHKQPGFNVVETIQRVKDALPRFSASLPASVHLSVIGDRTQTIDAAVHDVQLTMLITIVLVVLVIFFSIYLVADSQLISQNAPRLVPRRYQRIVRFVEVTMTEKVGGFIRGQIVMAIIVAVTTGLVAAILRVHFPLILGVLAFFFELIPTIGPILIGLSLALIAVFQSWVLLVEVLVFYIILHTIESNVLGPRIVGQAVGLPPFVSLVAIVAGAEAGGILGALFAVPATALFVTLAGAAIEEWKEQAMAVPEALPHDIVPAKPADNEPAPRP